MESKLGEFFDVFSKDDTIAALSQKEYADSIRRSEDRNGNYLFRVRVGQHTVAKSRKFTNTEARDAAMLEFIDWVEVALHGNIQRSFDFGRTV